MPGPTKPFSAGSISGWRSYKWFCSINLEKCTARWFRLLRRRGRALVVGGSEMTIVTVRSPWPDFCPPAPGHLPACFRGWSPRGTSPDLLPTRTGQLLADTERLEWQGQGSRAPGSPAQCSGGQGCDPVTEGHRGLAPPSPSTPPKISLKGLSCSRSTRAWGNR